MNRPFLLSIAVCICSLVLLALQPKDKGYKIRTVVIDAGHGGHDAGCLGSSAREKHVALDIALKLGKMLENNFPDIKVIYTRKTDVFIPLHERANIANKAHADLFICIHLNSGGKGAYGSETYVMGNHKSEDNLEVAKRENIVVTMEDDYKNRYDGFDPNSPEANIIFTLFQSQFMSQSLLLASNIQDEFTAHASRHNRGVKQAGFLVLYRTAMPAVLIECGFLTHDQEERFLASDRGQQLMATSIFRAFRSYKNHMESGKEIPAIQVAEKTDPDKVESGGVIKEGALLVKDSVEAKPVNNQTTDNTKTSGIEKNDTEPSKSGGQVKPIGGPSINEKTETGDSVNEPAANAVSGVFLTIQIGASQNPQKDDQKYLKKSDIKAIRCSDGFTRYVIGSFKNEEAARKKLQEIKSGTYKDAFLAAFNGINRLTVPEALQQLKK